MIRIHFHRQVRVNLRRRGFTLVEMLVSVALVLLLMTLFASIFQMATDSVKTQRGIAENDRKVRTLTTVLRADIAKRTMRKVLPFFPGEADGTSPTDFGDRGGYFTISTNRSDSGLDDVLQFTMNSGQLKDNLDTTEFIGRAEQLVDRSGTDALLTDTNLILSTTLNQPDVDDDNLNANATATSSTAEVSYFIRNGSLYRRQLLIREPIPLAGAALDAQPRNSAATDLFDGIDSTGTTYDGQFQLPRVDSTSTRADIVTDDFWTHFDFSATIDPADRTIPPDSISDLKAAFIGPPAMTNADDDPLAVALGKPNYRFGYEFNTGRPREYLTGGGLFMGRFLHAETSAGNFNYPQQHSTDEGAITRLADNTATANGNPFDINVEYSLNEFGVITTFDDVVGAASNGRGGPRAVEDLLLANVHEMRIEVWDDRLERYAPLSHLSLNSADVEGDYHISRRFNVNAGPVHTIVAPAVFDTWHPRVNLDMDGGGTFDDTERHPPFKAYSIYPPRAPAGPSPAGMPGPVPDDTNSSAGLSFWQANTEYAVGDVTFARFADADGDMTFEWFNDLPTVNPAVSSDGVADEGFELIFQCVAISDPDSNSLGFTGTTEPDWKQHTPGTLVTDGEVTWRVLDNRRPLKAIRIKLRFMNQATGNMRHLTLELSLQDES